MWNQQSLSRNVFVLFCLCLCVRLCCRRCLASKRDDDGVFPSAKAQEIADRAMLIKKLPSMLESRALLWCHRGEALSLVRSPSYLAARLRADTDAQLRIAEEAAFTTAYTSRFHTRTHALTETHRLNSYKTMHTHPHKTNSHTYLQRRVQVYIHLNGHAIYDVTEIFVFKCYYQV